MSTIDDFGGAGEALDDPPLGGPLGWAAAVRTAIRNAQTDLADRLPLTGGTLTGPLTVPGVTVTGAATFAQTPTIGSDVLARLWTGSQAQYDAIGTYDPDTLYVVV